jgi:hypothetical protein
VFAEWALCDERKEKTVSDSTGASGAIEQRIIQAAWDDVLGFQSVYNRPETLRWWTGERTSRTLTRSERKALYRLLEAGIIKRFHNPSNITRGAFEINRAVRARGDEVPQDAWPSLDR